MGKLPMETVEAIMTSLPIGMIRLRLPNAGITDESGNSIASGLRRFVELRNLNLSDNKLSQSAPRIFQALPRKLDFFAYALNNIGDAGAQSFAEVLHDLP